MEKANWRGDKFMKWDSCSGSGNTTNMSFEREKTSGSTGYTWPQRNYPCAFCKKQFKSAQALGGHMNVHRRERAQLRSTLLDHYPNPNTNPSPNPKPSFLGLPYASYHHSSLMISTPSLVSSDLSSKSPSTCIDQRKKMLRNGAFLGFGKLKSFIAQEEVEEDDDDEAMVLKKKEKIDRLELGLGLGSGSVRDEKEDLDLELRLGFS